MSLQIKKMERFKLKGRKGVSVMIGYVLLITLAVVMGGIIYQWMKTYVPSESLECPDGVSIMIKEVTCTLDGSDLRLNLTLKNNGRFDIGGYFIHATNDSEKELATIDLSPNLNDEYHEGYWMNPGVKFDAGNVNSLGPGSERVSNFNFTNTYFNTISSIEIIPVRWQVEKGKTRFVSCGNSKVREEVICS